MVPAHIKGARADLAAKLADPNAPMDYWNKHTTHELYDYYNDNVMSSLQWFHFQNLQQEKVKIVFVPSYLNGNDGIFNKTYWDLLIGMDITVFPSYYEPWGYTPLESVAFSVPTITTVLSGFGQWVKDNCEKKCGAGVVHRSDYNLGEVTSEIGRVLFEFSSKSEKERNEAKKNALNISKKALWENFISYYYEAYDIAMKNKDIRLKK